MRKIFRQGFVMLVFAAAVVGILYALGLLGLGKQEAGEAEETEETEEMKEGPRFGISHMTMNNPFFEAINEGIAEVVAEKGGSMLTLNPHLDLPTQINQMEDLITQKVDLIILSPVDGRGIRLSLERAREAGIPIVNVDAPVFDIHLVDAVVATDNYEAGVLIGQDILKKVPQPRIILLEHSAVKSGRDRMQGLLGIVSPVPQAQILARPSSKGQLELALSVMGDMLPAHPNVNVVMGINDLSAVGAYTAAKAIGLERQILIYGVDGSPEAKQFIKEGKIEGTAAQSPLTMGREAARIAYRILAKEELTEEDRTVTIPPTLITRENIGNFKIEGWQ